MALKLAIASGALFVLGILIAQIRILPPLACFGVSVVGGAIGLAVLPVALVAWKNGSGGGRELLFIGLGVALWALPIAMLASARGKPRINDISSDPVDPPQFVALAAVPENAGRNLHYPEGNRALQQVGYPDVAPLQLSLPPGEALARATTVAEGLGWKVVEVAADAGRLEATQESRAFRFVDDVVVRVRPAAGGSRLDVRSKSRDGKGDLGKNAERIRAFVRKMAKAS